MHAESVDRAGPFGRPKIWAVVIATNAIMKSGEFDMKKLTLAAAAFVALTGSAIAADLPRKAPAALHPLLCQSPLGPDAISPAVSATECGIRKISLSSTGFRSTPNIPMEAAVGSAESAAVATTNFGRGSWSAR